MPREPAASSVVANIPPEDFTGDIDGSEGTVEGRSIGRVGDQRRRVRRSLRSHPGTVCPHALVESVLSPRLRHPVFVRRQTGQFECRSCWQVLTLFILVFAIERFRIIYSIQMIFNSGFFQICLLHSHLEQRCVIIYLIKTIHSSGLLNDSN